VNPVVLFDGDCHFCHSSVQFIIKRDSQEIFYFAAQQSDAGQELLKEYRVPADIDSIVLIENGKAYIKSTAVLRICRHLSGGWKCLYVFRFMPIVIRDAVYHLIARNRYKWFGKEESCSIPSDRVRKRFL
jgi:predicted DCC family thiol-disulfide oxidoreductase YuxK